MKREEPIPPPSGFQDWHIKRRKAICSTCPFSQRQMGKIYFHKGFPTLTTKDDLQHQNVSWIQDSMKDSVRSLNESLHPSLPEPNPEVWVEIWVLPCSLFLCLMVLCRAEAWKSQDLSDLTGSQRGTSEACSLGVWCSCISGTVWGDEGVRSNHFRKAKQSFHFSGKLKIFFLHSGWNAGVGILVQKNNNGMEILSFEHLNCKRFQIIHANTASDKRIPPHEGSEGK